MSRRNKAVRRPVPPDPRYDSQTVSKFINSLMYQGKKSNAERIFYSAMDMIEERKLLKAPLRTATVIRGSTAAAYNVVVPPPERPIQPTPAVVSS